MEIQHSHYIEIYIFLKKFVKGTRFTSAMVQKSKKVTFVFGVLNFLLFGSILFHRCTTSPCRNICTVTGFIHEPAPSFHDLSPVWHHFCQCSLTSGIKILASQTKPLYSFHIFLKNNFDFIFHSNIFLKYIHSHAFVFLKNNFFFTIVIFFCFLFNFAKGVRFELKFAKGSMKTQYEMFHVVMNLQQAFKNVIY